MPFVKNDPSLTPAPLGMWQAHATSRPEGSVLGAGFRLENDVYNASRSLLEFSEEYDPTFNPFDAMKDDPLADQYAAKLVRARNAGHYAQIQQQVRQELSDRELISAHPIGGFVASAVAGTLSPAMLIPLVGQARGVKGLMQTVSLAAAAAGVQEATLYATQATRSPEEAWLNIGLGTLIGATLGTTVKYLRNGELRAMEHGMANRETRVTILSSDASGELVQHEMETLAKNYLPRVTEDVRPRDAVTVYGNEGTPLRAVVDSVDNGTVRVRLDDGQVVTLGERYQAVPVQSAEFKVDYNSGKVPVKDIPSEDIKPLKDSIEAEMVAKAIQKQDVEHLMAQRNALIFEALRRVNAPSKFLEKIKTLEPDDIAAARAAEMDLIEVAKEAKGKRSGEAELFYDETPVLEFASARVGDESVNAARVNRDPGELLRQQTKLAEGARKLRRAIEEGGDANEGAIAAAVRKVAARTVAPDVIGTLARLNPVTHMMDSKFASLRYAAALFQDVNLKTGRTLEHGPVVQGGDIMSRAQLHFAKEADFIQAFDELYAEYLFGATGKRKWGQEVYAQFKSGAALLPDGKMSYREFAQQVVDLANTGDPAPNKQLASAVTELNKFFSHFEELAGQYHEYRKVVDNPEARPLFEPLEFGEDSDLANYVRHLFDVNKVEEDAIGFINMLRDNARANLNRRFGKNFESFKQGQDKLEQVRTALGLTPEQRNFELDKVNATIEVVKSDPIWVWGQKVMKENSEKLKAEGLEGAELRQAREEFRSSLGPDYFELDQLLREASSQKKLLQELGAGASDTQSKLYDRADELVKLQLRQFDTFVNAARKAQKELDKVSDAKLDEGLAKAQAHVDKIAKTLRTHEGRLNKVFLSDDLTRFDELSETVVKAQERLDAALAKMENLSGFDREAARDVINEALDVSRLRAQQLNAKRAVREESLKQRAKELDPQKLEEYRTARLKEVEEELRTNVEEFQEKWRAEGADDIDLKAGAADFDNVSKELANTLYRKIVSNPSRLVGMDIVGEQRGPELRRTLNIPYDIKKNYLVRDAEYLVRSYLHTMGSDLEIYRATGSPNGKPLETAFDLEVDVAREKLAAATHLHGNTPVNASTFTGDASKLKPITDTVRKKLSADFEASVKEGRRDLVGIIERARHQRGVPAHPNGFIYRTARVFENANVFRLMGMVMPSSIADIARPIHAFGISKTFQHGWKPFVTDMARVKFTRQQARRMGVALDPVLHNRAHAMFDFGTNYTSRKTKFERGVEFLANKTGLVALFDRWTAEMKHIASSVTATELSHALRVFNEQSAGKEFTQAKELLYGAGLSNEDIRMIWKQYQTKGGSQYFESGDVWLPNAENWTDAEAFQAFSAAMHRSINHQIITPGLDRPLWVDQNQGFRLVAQFRSFSFTSTNRVLMSMMQEPDMAALQSIIFSLAMGALSQYTWAVAKGGSSYDRTMQFTPEQWAYESFMRSGLLGVLTEGMMIGEQIPALNDWAVFGGEGRPTRRASSVMGQLFGPSYGMMERMIGLLQSMDEPTQKTLHDIRVTMVPYQNAVLFSRLFDQMEKAAGNLLNLPERRE